MSINIQLVEIPENEQVANRQIALPQAGGTIGRAYDCTIQLPDFSKKLSRVHVQISRDSQGRYQVVNKSTNGMEINGKAILRGQYQYVGDGDIWRIGDYSLLVTDLSALSDIDLEPSAQEAPSAIHEPLFASKDFANGEFSIDEFDVTDAQVVDAGNLKMRSENDDAVVEMNVEAPRKKSASGFSAKNALGDVELGLDPFADDEQMQPSSFPSGLTIESPTVESDSMQQSLQQLTMLLAQQKNNPDPYSYDVLMQCIQSSMDKFIEELSPEYLEEMFDGYISGWGNRDKKYWQLYKKQFNRKLARREFHRQFTSIFMEELRGKK